MSSVRRDLHAMVGDAAAGNVMVGIGETYLPAFVLAMTASHVASGLIQTVPLLMGAVLQLAAPALLRRTGSYRVWILGCVAVQATAFLPLAAIGLVAGMPCLLVFVMAAVYWGAGMSTSPAWNAWVGTLVPQRIRARYFARRALVCQAGILAGFLAGGMTLQYGKETSPSALGHAPLAAFAVLFFTAAGARYLSVHFLSRQAEPVLPADEPLSLRWSAMLATLDRAGNGRTLAYLLVAQAAVQISGPYFTPYMLGQLEFSYFQYAALIAIAYGAKIACLPALGRVADRWGAPRLLGMGGLAIVPVAGLWVVSDRFAWLMVAQLVSGCAWAAYELAMMLLFFETIPRRQRVAVITVFNLFNAVAIVSGSVVGAALLAWIGENQAAYLTLFTASTLARAGALLLMVRTAGRAETLVTSRSAGPALRPLGLLRRAAMAPGDPTLPRPHGRDPLKSADAPDSSPTVTQ